MRTLFLKLKVIKNKLKSIKNLRAEYDIFPYLSQEHSQLYLQLRTPIPRNCLFESQLKTDIALPRFLKTSSVAMPFRNALTNPSQTNPNFSLVNSITSLLQTLTPQISVQSLWTSSHWCPPLSLPLLHCVLTPSKIPQNLSLCGR